MLAAQRVSLFPPLDQDPDMKSRFEDALQWSINADAWDSTLWDAWCNNETNTFNGDIKEINQAFERGLQLALHDQEYFIAWHDGFVEALGISIHTMVARLEEALEEEEDA